MISNDALRLCTGSCVLQPTQTSITTDQITRHANGSGPNLQMDVARQKKMQLRNSQVFCGGFVFLRPDTQNVSPPSSTYTTNGSALSMRLLSFSSLNMRCKSNGACPDCYAGNGVAQQKAYDVAPRNFKLEGCNLFQQRGHDARSNSPVISLCWVLFELFAGGCYSADMMNTVEPYGNVLLPARKRVSFNPCDCDHSWSLAWVAQRSLVAPGYEANGSQHTAHMSGTIRCHKLPSMARCKITYIFLNFRPLALCDKICDDEEAMCSLAHGPKS